MHQMKLRKMKDEIDVNPINGKKSPCLNKNETKNNAIIFFIDILVNYIFPKS